MKIAVAGKGGAGKTTIAATLARLVARRGVEVVAIDCDPSPMLGLHLGLTTADAEAQVAILNGLLAEGHTHHDPTPDPEDLLRRFGRETADGVRLVVTGKIERPSEGCLCCGSHRTTRSFVGTIDAHSRVVVADLEAGLNDLLWVKPTAEDVVLAVAEPSAKAVDIARRVVAIAEELGVTSVVPVLNKCAAADDAEWASSLLAREVIAIPDDAAVTRAEALGIPALDADPTSPAMVALGELAERLLSS